MSKGKMFVISGASGVGKSTVLKQVMAGRDDLHYLRLRHHPPAPTRGGGRACSYYFVTRARASRR